MVSERTGESCILYKFYDTDCGRWRTTKGMDQPTWQGLHNLLKQPLLLPLKSR